MSRISVLLLFILFAVVSFSCSPTDYNEFGEVSWLKYDDAVALASKLDRHVIVDFSTEWCSYCKKLDTVTFRDQEVMNLIGNHFVAARVDCESSDYVSCNGVIYTERDLARQEFGVRAYPTIWFLYPDGRQFTKITGYVDANHMAEVLVYIKRKLYERMSWDDYLNAGGRKLFTLI